MLSMTIIVVTLLTAAANVASAAFDFARVERILVAMTNAGVPHSLLPLLGVLKAAGAAGLLAALAGLAPPWLGTAAAAGLVAFFVLAVGTHLRARDNAIGLPLGFLALAVATLALGLAG